MVCKVISMKFEEREVRHLIWQKYTYNFVKIPYDVPKILFTWKIACHFLWCSQVKPEKCDYTVIWDTDVYNDKITIPKLSFHKGWSI